MICACGRHIKYPGPTRKCWACARSANGKKAATHRRTGTVVHRTWVSMRERCSNKSSPLYKNYGGRGISVCDRWDDFTAFLEDMGPRPSKDHSIDRIDNDGNYEPSNCRWATKTEQANNRRTCRYLTHEGVTMSASDWSHKLFGNRHTVTVRLGRGWSIERALTQPKKGGASF